MPDTWHWRKVVPDALRTGILVAASDCSSAIADYGSFLKWLLAHPVGMSASNLFEPSLSKQAVNVSIESRAHELAPVIRDNAAMQARPGFYFEAAEAEAIQDILQPAEQKTTPSRFRLDSPFIISYCSWCFLKMQREFQGGVMRC